MSSLSYLLAFVFAFAGAAATTPLVRALALRTRFVAPVRKDRWHSKPTALLGGIGIYAGFICGFAYLRITGQLDRGGLLVACASSMFVLGLVDDVVQLKPYTKLVAQMVAAVVQTAFGLSLEWTPWHLANQALTVFWLVGVTNALNLLDNIDGLSAGIAMLAAAFMAYLLGAGGFHGEAMLVLAFAAATLGFLLYNFNPASIFMGDSGSLFLGFFLGGAALYQGQLQQRSNLISVLGPPVLVLALPIFDTTLVTITRRLAGRPISQGGRDHASHRLVELGLSERGATLTLYGIAALSGLAAVLASHAPQSIALGLLPVFLLLVFFVAIFLARVKVYKRVEDPDAPSALDASGASRARLPTFVEFAYKRRIFEVLNDFALILVAYYGAFLLRFDGDWVEPHFSLMMRSLPLIVVIQLVTLWLSGLYGGLWRYTSLADLRRIFGSSVLAALLGALGVGIRFGGFAGFSRGMFVIDGMLLFLGIAGSRVSFRLMRDWLVARADASKKRRVLVYGAGDAGELVLRELRQNTALGMVAVGFIDDDDNKKGVVIHGVPVLGGRTTLPTLLSSHTIQDLVLSTALPDFDTLERLCNEHSVRIRRMKIDWQ